LQKKKVPTKSRPTGVGGLGGGGTQHEASGFCKQVRDQNSVWGGGGGPKYFEGSGKKGNNFREKVGPNRGGEKRAGRKNRKAAKARLTKGNGEKGIPLGGENVFRRENP